MMLMQPKLVEPRNKSISRESSCSTRSGSGNSLSDFDECSSSQSARKDVCNRIAFESSALQLSLKVKNTFLHVKLGSGSEDLPRRRAASAPPQLLTVRDAIETEDMPQPTNLADIPAETMQPVVMCVIPVMAWTSVPSHAQQVVAMPESTLPQQVAEHRVSSLWQDVQRAELAAAALRAQKRLEEMEGQPVRDPAQCNSRRQGDRNKHNQTESDSMTTLMLRNIPNDFTREMLLNMLNTEGFAGKYDFVYLPIDFARSANLGYAFVNSLTHEGAVEMQRRLEGFCSWNIRSSKKCHVVWSSTQGISQHIKNYRNSPVMHEDVAEECKPVLFRQGERAAFPPPTQKLRAPTLNGKVGRASNRGK